VYETRAARNPCTDCSSGVVQKLSRQRRVYLVSMYVVDLPSRRTTVGGPAAFHGVKSVSIRIESGSTRERSTVT